MEMLAFYVCLTFALALGFLLNALLRMGRA